MKLKKWQALVIGAAIGVPLGLGAATTPAAAAPVVHHTQAAPKVQLSGSQICDENNYALNLWGGIGGHGYINAYTCGASNEDISIQPINGRCQAGSPYTTVNCPWSGVPAGLLIFQLVGNWGQCLGDYGGSSGNARLGGFDACNNVNTGGGGSYGTVFFSDNTGGCDSLHFSIWSFHWRNGGIGYNDSNGSAVYENVFNANCVN